MSRLWVAVGIVAALFAAFLLSAGHLEDLGKEVNDILSRAEEAAHAGDWAAAGALTNEARERWEKEDLYLHTLLRHSDADEVESLFLEVAEYAESGEEGEYSAGNARLRKRIRLIYEAEQLRLENVF